MESFLPFLPIILLLLLCPLMMVGIPVAAWVIARSRGEKGQFSMGCMSGKCEHAEHAQQGSGLQEEVTRLRQEVHALRSELGPSGNGARSENLTVPVTPEEQEPSSGAAGTAEKEDG